MYSTVLMPRSSLHCFPNCPSLCWRPVSLSPTTPDNPPLSWTEWSEIRRRGKKQSNNWAHAEQRPLMCFLNGLPKSFSRNAGPSQYISVEKYRQLSLFESSSPTTDLLPSSVSIFIASWKRPCDKCWWTRLMCVPCFVRARKAGGDGSTVRSWPPLQVHAKKGQQLYVCVTARPLGRKSGHVMCVWKRKVCAWRRQFKQARSDREAIQAPRWGQRRDISGLRLFSRVSRKPFVEPSFPFPRARTHTRAYARSLSFKSQTMHNPCRIFFCMHKVGTGDKWLLNINHEITKAAF